MGNNGFFYTNGLTYKDEVNENQSLKNSSRSNIVLVIAN